NPLSICGPPFSRLLVPPASGTPKATCIGDGQIRTTRVAVSARFGPYICFHDFHSGRTVSSIRAAVAICFVVASTLPAQQKLTFEHLRQLTGVGGVQLSPDGKTAVVAVTRADYSVDRNVSELWAVDVATGAARQLTFERKSVASPLFSPDGQTLAFLAADS